MAKKSKKSAAPVPVEAVKVDKTTAVPAAQPASAAKPTVKVEPAKAAPTKSAAATAPAVVSPVAPAPVAKPTAELISARAHQIWIDEGRPAGKSLDHWIRAERELGA
ncbi:MAG: DUF2934 domain-containing protein [Planctomycetes bacterium]|nr:DUF2934 domain-containing protein [Planctomycetota bacterium]